MDDIAHTINEEVVIQKGSTKYVPKNAKYFDFASMPDMKKLNGEARIVVSHAGVGAILTALEEGVPIVIFPRLKKYNEVIDDHQLEIAEAMENDANVKVAREVSDLERYLGQGLKATGRLSRQNELSANIRHYLEGHATI